MAVSYTHLDVYKRQRQDNENKLYVRLYGIKKYTASSLISENIPCVYVSLTVRKYCDLNVGSKVKLQYYVPDLDHILGGIEVYMPEDVVSNMW